MLAMVVSLLLLCAVIVVVAAAYLWLVSYVSLFEIPGQLPLEDNAKPLKHHSLSESDLQRLPTVEYCGKEGEERLSVCGNDECPVCLEPFQNRQRCRVIPACGHAFHVHCADAWLSRRPVCPICRRSATIEGEKKNSVNGGTTAVLQEADGESGRSRSLPTTERGVVDVWVA